jgi:hypothetical protein
MTNNLIYMQSCKVLDTKSEDFNLEGVTYDGENWYLFNRGNSDATRMSFTLHKKLNQEFSLFSNDYKLPK